MVVLYDICHRVPVRIQVSYDKCSPVAVGMHVSYDTYHHIILYRIMMITIWIVELLNGTKLNRSGNNVSCDTFHDSWLLHHHHKDKSTVWVILCQACKKVAKDVLYDNVRNTFVRVPNRPILSVISHRPILRLTSHSRSLTVVNPVSATSYCSCFYHLIFLLDRNTVSLLPINSCISFTDRTFPLSIPMLCVTV